MIILAIMVIISYNEYMNVITRTISYSAIVDGTVVRNLREIGISVRICTLLRREMGLITVAGSPVRAVDWVSVGDIITINIMENVEEVVKYNHPVDIVYEDEDIAVINKSPDIAVIATNAHYGQCLNNALASVWGDFVYHPVNRLDKGTSGLMLVARNSLAHSMLSEDIIADTMQGKKVRREYIAIVEGRLTGSGDVNLPIGMPYEHTMIRGIDALNGKEALTFYESIYSSTDYSVIKLRLATGRTHQIRVHMAHIGHPLMGDDLYGAQSIAGGRPLLHSHSITFSQPLTRELLTFTAEPPLDMQCYIK